MKKNAFSLNKYIVVFENEESKLKGYKIFDGFDEIQEILQHYKKMKKIKLFVNEQMEIKYLNYEDLEKDIEFFPITDSLFRHLTDTFLSASYGVFPL